MERRQNLYILYSHCLWPVLLLANMRAKLPKVAQLRRASHRLLHRLELPPQRSRPIYRPRPSVLSVQSICRKISGQTGGRYGLLDAEKVVQCLNGIISGWASYFILGQVSSAYCAIDMHVAKRLRQWFCPKHKMGTGKYVRFLDEKLWETYGLRRLVPRIKDFPWAKS